VGKQLILSFNKTFFKMEKVFETENVVLFENEGKIVGNVSKEEAYQALEQAGVEALKELDFDTTMKTVGLAARVIESYEQGDIEESEEKEDKILDTLLDIIKGAYEVGMLDELFVLTAMTHKFTGKSVIDQIGQVQEQILKDKKG
jgi:hypothetical protein